MTNKGCPKCKCSFSKQNLGNESEKKFTCCKCGFEYGLASETAKRLFETSADWLSLNTTVEEMKKTC